MSRIVMDYLIEQGSRYDGTNLKYENDVRNTIRWIYDRQHEKMMSHIQIYDSIGSMLQLQMCINGIMNIMEDANRAMNEVFSVELPRHIDKGYGEMGDLIDIGMEVSNRLSKDKLTEMKGIVDNNTVEYAKHHAFEYVKKLSNETADKLRSELTHMMITKQYDKKKFSSMVEHTMSTNKSRADAIAQSEMSMAYNTGALERMEEFNRYSEHTMKKYWYGFKYSKVTCEYCKPRIGLIYDIDDNTEELPAHPRCRCVWLPYLDGWDSPIPSEVTRRADMLVRAYSPSDIYRKIDSRLGIKYAENIPIEDASAYLEGDRSDKIMKSISKAREGALEDIYKSFKIPDKVSGNGMDQHYESQMGFWKNYVAEHIVDGDKDELKNAYKGIKGVMALTWSGKQLDYFSRLLDAISDNI